MTSRAAQATGPLPILMIAVVPASESTLAAQAPSNIFRGCDVCPKMVVLP